jgi:hypothetical protein
VPSPSPSVPPAYRVRCGEEGRSPALANARPKFDARSFSHLAKNPEGKHRDDVLVVQSPSYSVRTNRHEYVRRGGQADELCDLDGDPQESRNLAKEQSSLRIELAMRLRERLVQGKWLR